MRLVGKIFIWTFSILLGLVTILAGIFHFYKDDIEQFAIDQLNERLKSPVVINKIEISIWKNFPEATIEFYGVYVPGANGAKKKSDTLFYADRFSMSFDVWDMLDEDYTVKSMYAVDGVINIVEDENGDGNYDIFKPQPESDDSGDGGVEFQLSQVDLERFRVRYQNLRSKQDYQFKIAQANLQGAFYKDEYDIAANSDFEVLNFWNKNVNLIKNKTCKINTKINVYDGDTSTYTLDKTDLRVEDMDFIVQGVVSSDTNTHLDLNIEGDHIDLASMLTSFSKSLTNSFSSYSSTGIVDFQAGIKGYVDNGMKPNVNAEFAYENGSITEPGSGITLKDANMKGRFTNANTSGLDELEIDEFTAVLPDGKLNAQFKIEDFLNPLVEGKVKGDLNLQTLQTFLKLESVDRITGRLYLDAKLKTRITAPDDFETRNIKIYHSSGLVETKGVNLRLRDSDLKIQDLNGAIVLNGYDAAIKELYANIGESDFSFDGAFKNLLPYILFDKEKLKIVANVDSKMIHLEDLVGTGETNEVYTTTSSSGFALPSDIDLNLKLDLNEVDYGALHSTEVSGKLILIDQVLHAKDLSLKTAGGKLSGRLRIDGSTGNFNITSQAKIARMEVDQLFEQFENFGQNMILPENIKGKITADVDFSCQADGDLNILQESIVALANVSLTNGELNHLDAMKEITDYMRDNRAANFLFKKHINDIEQRLLGIKFRTLTNQISIKDRVITIPKMEIGSSAMNIHLSGTHSFDDEIDYHIDFKFKDLKAAKDETNFGNVIDDGTGLTVFMRMYGTVDEPMFELDKASMKEQRQQIIQEEKQQTKAILQESLGLFKKDTTLKIKERKQEEVEFILYEGELEEENEPELNPVKEKRKRKKSNKSRAGKLFDKLLQDKEADKTPQIDMEIEDDN